MPPDRKARAKALANTYATIDNRTGWDRVEEYQRVLEYRGSHPNAGSQAAATTLELPRSRIRPWFDGGKPDPVHAIDTAEEHGWLDATPGDPTFEGFVVLTAWTFAGGSISADTWTPRFAVGGGDPRNLAVAALKTVGLRARIDRDGDPDRATEITPNKNSAAHLGRYLYAVMESPIGEKNTERIALPEWLDTVALPTRLRFARTYVTLRGTPINPSHGYVCQIREERPQSYLEALGGLFESLAPPETVSVGSKIVRLREGSASELDVIPQLPENDPTPPSSSETKESR